MGETLLKILIGVGLIAAIVGYILGAYAVGYLIGGTDQAGGIGILVATAGPSVVFTAWVIGEVIYEDFL